MATLQQVDAHRKAVEDVTTLAVRDLVAAWRTLTLDDAAEATRQVTALLPLIIDGYGTAIASLSADWYDELRDAAAAGGRYIATTGELPQLGRVEALARWGVGPLWSANPDPDLALSLIVGGTQRLLAGVGRDTVIGNVGRDPGQAMWARQAAPGACAFCAMVATRDAAYVSEAAALTVVGRGTAKRFDGTRADTRRRGLRSRGSRSLGQKFHDFCKCTAVPVWPGDGIERADYVDDWEQAYIEATRATAKVTPENPYGAINTKAVLAHMRKSLGIS